MGVFRHWQATKPFYKQTNELETNVGLALCPIVFVFLGRAAALKICVVRRVPIYH